MKQSKTFFSLLVVAFFGIALTASAQNENVPPQENPLYETDLPANVVVALEKSCFGCHNSESQNEDAREHLNLTTFNDLNTPQKILAFEEIAEVLEEGEMPPERFLERFPDRAPTETEKELLMNWVVEEAARLSEEE